jgi:hypothetical protein
MRLFFATLRWTQLVVAVLLTAWAAWMTVRCFWSGNAFCALMFTAMAAMGYFVFYRSARDEIRQMRNQD